MTGFPTDDAEWIGPTDNDAEPTGVVVGTDSDGGTHLFGSPARRCADGEHRWQPLATFEDPHIGDICDRCGARRPWTGA